ncbi:MAG: hypothetical protein D6705_14735 [Deltaproteobacteria bacterium]|nr:MAG: hypothetical protein D6705_14735 [Deltaproteobacteria bacterium]
MKRRSFLQTVAAMTLSALALSAASPTAMASGDARTWVGRELVTTKNLHPDEARARLYAANFQQDGLIPVCTKVRVEKVTRKAMVFTVLETGRTYTYYTHKSLREPFFDHLTRYFGERCPDLSRLSERDREGIRRGEALVGMTKKGVAIAIGLPPAHETPSPKSPRWKYWKNRFDTFIVLFGEDGKVAAIQD